MQCPEAERDDADEVAPAAGRARPRRGAYGLIVVHADRLARWRRAAAPSRVPINPALDFDPDAGRPGVRDQDGAAEGRPRRGERPKEALIRSNGVVHEHNLAAQGGHEGFP